MQDGMRRMFQEQEDVFYYLTVMNENYEHPEMPAGAEADILKGMYLFRKGAVGRQEGRTACATAGLRHHLPRSHRRRRPAQERLGRRCRHLGLPELQRTGARRQRRDALEHAQPDRKPRLSHVEHCLNDTRGPVVAATDYIRLFAEQIRPLRQPPLRHARHRRFRPFRHARKAAHFFEVDRHWVTLAALKALADEGAIDRSKVAEAILKYGIDVNKPNPMSV
jgi:pyruvate dehydrogenase E1 component